MTKKVSAIIFSMLLIQGCGDPDKKAPYVSAKSTFDCSEVNTSYALGDNNRVSRILISAYRQLDNEYQEDTPIQNFYRGLIKNNRDYANLYQQEVLSACDGNPDKGVNKAATEALNTLYEKIGDQPRWATCRSFIDGSILSWFIYKEMLPSTEIRSDQTPSSHPVFTVYSSSGYGPDYLSRRVLDYCRSNPDINLWAAFNLVSLPVAGEILKCEQDWRDNYTRETRALVIPADEVSSHWVNMCRAGKEFSTHDFNNWYKTLDPKYKDIAGCKQRWTSAALQEGMKSGDYSATNWKRQQEFERLCLDGIEYEERNTEKNDQECLDHWIAEHRKYEGEDSIIRGDVIDQWEHWCVLGRTPSNFDPESQPSKTAAELEEEEEDRCIALWKDSFIKEFGADEHIYIHTEVEWRQSCERGEYP